MLAEKAGPSGGHRRSTSSKGFLLIKGNWNLKRTKIHSHFDTNIAQTVFWVKKFLYLLYQPYLFDFFLKRLLNQQFAPLKGLGGATVSLCINCIFFAPFVSFAKNTLFLVLVVKVYLFLL